MITYRFRQPGAQPVRTEVRFYDHGRGRWLWRERDATGRVVIEGECDAEDVPDDVKLAVLKAPHNRPYVPWCDTRVSNP